jgi:hypothetical protein
MIKAFVGHSFADNNREVVRGFLDFFDKVVKLGLGFSWDHAEPAEPKELSLKVKEKMDGKNLFIGICTSREKVIDNNKLDTVPLINNRFWGHKNDFSIKTSDWVLQEIGFAVGRKMNLIIFLEEGVKFPGGIQGNLEYITFNREYPDRCFGKLIEMLQALTISPSQTQANESITNEKQINKNENSENEKKNRSTTVS